MTFFGLVFHFLSPAVINLLDTFRCLIIYRAILVCIVAGPTTAAGGRTAQDEGDIAVRAAGKQQSDVEGGTTGQ